MSNYLIAIASGCLQKTGGAFTLTVETDFGATYGLKSAYYKSRGTNPASAGQIRLANAETIKWRNAANSADLGLAVSAANALQFDGTSLTLSGAIVNADISASAAIAYSKLAALTASRALVSDGYGVVSVSAVTSAELGYVSGVTSAIQTQINTKAPSASPTFSGTVTTPLTASRAVVTGAASELAASTTTAAELGYVNGVTSAIQTQLDAKAGLASPSFTTPTLGVATATSLAMGEALAASSLLDVASTTKGFLEPRMTQAQRDAISSPATGLQVYNTDTNKLNFYNGTSWSEVGSGSSGVNYITATDGSVIGDWVTYDDGASATPVDGTGGTPGVTYAVSTDSSMRGATNFLFTHDAADRQGEGFSTAFTIDPSDKGKVLQINLEYLIASGTFADDGLDCWVYDVTNSRLIQPAPTHFKNSSLIEKFACEFQSSIDSASYRLIFHVTTATATAYTIRFDTFSVGPQAKLYGSPITDWVSFTPTGGWTTNTTYTGRCRRVGDSMEVVGYVSLAGAPNSANLTINIPGGYTIDTSKLSAGTPADNNTVFGQAVMRDAGTAVYVGSVHYENTTRVGIKSLPSDIAYLKWTVVDATTPFTFGASDDVGFKFSVPILGWSSSVVMSNDAATNVVAARYTRSATASQSVTMTVLDYNTKVYDTHGAVTTGASWKFTAPVLGYYRVTAAYSTSSANVFIYYLQMFKNGVVVSGTSQTRQSINGAPESPQLVDTILLNAGDYIDFRQGVNTGTDTIGADGGLVYVNIERISGPAQIAASNTVGARFTTAAGQSIDNAVDEIVDFVTVDFDYTGAVTVGASWKFTAQSAGLFNVLVTVGFTANATGIRQIAIFKNGSAVSILGYEAGNASVTSLVSGHTHIKLVAGDYIDIRAYQNSGAGLALINSALYNHISIIRVGNY